MSVYTIAREIAHRETGQTREALMLSPTANGYTIHRGPMAADHFTQVHNLIARGYIPTKYVGVYAYIISHQRGWKLTEQRICDDLQVGRDFVRSALKALSVRMILTRHQVRLSSGRLGESIWFVTDIPVQLEQLGITNKQVIQERVTAELDRFLDEIGHDEAGNPSTATTCENTTRNESFTRSDRMTENPSTVLTSGDTTRNESFRSSDRMTENPSTVTTSGNASKNESFRRSDGTNQNRCHIREEEEKENQENPPPTPPLDGARRRYQDADGGGNTSVKTENMDKAVKVVDGLPKIQGNTPTSDIRTKLINIIAEKIDQGWTTRKLTDSLTSDISTARSVNIYLHRLSALGTPPVQRTAPVEKHPYVPGGHQGMCATCGRPDTNSAHPQTARAARCQHGRPRVLCQTCDSLEEAQRAAQRADGPLVFSSLADIHDMDRDQTRSSVRRCGTCHGRGARQMGVNKIRCHECGGTGVVSLIGSDLTRAVESDLELALV